MPPPLRSEIWAYFKPDEQDPDKAHCNICNKIYSRKGRTTTSLKNHLKAVHVQEFLLLESFNKEKQFNAEKTVSPLQDESTHRSIQFSLEEVFLKEIEFGNSNDKSKQVDKFIGEMIALQNLSFNFVEGLGFRRLIKLLAPEYTLRERSFYTDYVCRELYGKITAKVKQLIEIFDYMSFTYNIWSDSSSNSSFLIVTGHGISENFDKTSIVLKCERNYEVFSVNDTITPKFYSILSEWNIETEQVHNITRNNCSNIKKEEDIVDINCIVNKIELCIRSALQSHENVKLVKQKCEEICKHFKHSSLAQKQLEIIQDKMNQPHVQVFHNDTVRWNGTYYMFERFLKVKDAVCFYNNETDIEPILPEDWNIIESCVDLFKPFEEATQELSNSHALISSVIPILYVIKIKVEEYLTRSHDSESIQFVTNTLRAELSSIWSYVFEEKIFLIATYLDPRFKHKFFSPVTEKKIKQTILKIMKIENHDLGSSNSWGPKRKKTKDSTEYYTEQPGPSETAIRPSLINNLAMLLESSSEYEASMTSKSDSAEAALKKELLSYRNEKRININENPLSWWRVHREKLKLMSSLARRFLSPPAASFQSQQFYSDTGLMKEPQLNRLDSDEAAILFFIKYNAPIFDFNY